MEFFLKELGAKYNYWIYIFIMLIGLYGMIGKNNLIKKLTAMNIFQTAIILFYVSIGYKKNATIPIIKTAHHIATKVNPNEYINPLPHVLMLTAIVVSVSTFGVALAIAIKIYEKYKSLEEDEIMMRLGDKD